MPTSISIESILKDFYDISGIRISIHDTEFNEIYSYPKESTAFCSYIQREGNMRKDCLYSDSLAFNKVKATGEVYVYKCRLGLIEAVAPIYHYGTLAGYIMMGQIRELTNTSYNYILSRSKCIFKDAQEAQENVSAIRTIERGLIDSYINIMSVLAEYLTTTNRLFNHNEKLPQMVREYINKNYSSKITLSVLNLKFGCCNATLTKSFKKEYGVSIMTYIANVRLKKAEEMIVKSRKSFKEISSECGFYDQNYFSKAFTKAYGLSPKEYRLKKSIDP